MVPGARLVSEVIKNGGSGLGANNDGRLQRTEQENKINFNLVRINTAT